MKYWPIIQRIISFLFFYIGWGICLECASQGEPYIGPLVVFGMLVFHLGFIKRRMEELFLVITVALAGTVIDSIYSFVGLIHYKAGYPAFPHLAPLWLTSVWVLYAMCLNYSLSWFYQRWILASVLGASTAILSYLAGERVGAIVFLHPTFTMECTIGLVWAVAFPLSLIYSRWVSRQFANCRFCKQ